MKSVRELKVGDRVVAEYFGYGKHPGKVGTIERITQTQIVLDDGSLWTRNGREWGAGQSYSYWRLYAWTPERAKERDYERHQNTKLRAEIKDFEEALGDADDSCRDADVKAKLAHSVIHDLAGAFARLVTAVDLFDLGRITPEQLGTEVQASRAKFSAALDRLTEKPTSCQHPRALQVPPYYNGTSWCPDCGAVRGTGANGRNTKWRVPGDEDAKWEWEWEP